MLMIINCNYSVKYIVVYGYAMQRLHQIKSNNDEKISGNDLQIFGVDGSK